MISAVGLAFRAILANELRRLLFVAALDEQRRFARSELKRLDAVAFGLTGDKFVSRRFANASNKVRKKWSWTAMRDALNEYRNIARKKWRAAPVKESRGKKTRSSIARAYQIRRMNADTLAAFVSYKRGPAKKANLLEWSTRRTRGKLVGTTAFEQNRQFMLRVIAKSLQVQIRQDPENAKARRQAYRAVVGSANAG
tara:strand:- start:1454 stop:2044 length:591 start_codon:yes stop_codon:yes gene_type:complete